MFIGEDIKTKLMTFFTLTILCSLLSSGYLQEINSADYNADKSTGSDWPQQSYHTNPDNLYGQEERSSIPQQPCARRSNSESEPIKQHAALSPKYVPKIDTVVTNDNTASLKPHALRNGDYNLKTSNKQEPPPYPQLNNDVNSVYKSRNSLIISNPVIDSFEEIHHVIIPEINNEERDNILKPINQPHTVHSSDSPPSLRAPNSVHSPPSRDVQAAPTNVFHYLPSKEYGIALDSQYYSLPGHVFSPEHHVIHSTVNNDIDSVPSTNFIAEPINDLRYEPTHILSLEPANELHSEPNKQEPLSKVNDDPSTPPNKCTHEEPINLEGHSRRSMSSYNDDDTLQGNHNSDNDLVHSNNDQFIESRNDNENAMASVLNVKPLKSSQDQNMRNYAKSKVSPHEKAVLRAKPQYNESRREMIEPTRGNGVSNMGQSSLMLMQTERICYACSTANDPSCWTPDRRTTVKYCRRGNNACITKIFGSGSTYTLIRDCGRSCDDNETGGLSPKYKSCSMCHTELCNGAYSINGYSIILAILIIPLIKYLN